MLLIGDIVVATSVSVGTIKNTIQHVINWGIEFQALPISTIKIQRYSELCSILCVELFHENFTDHFFTWMYCKWNNFDSTIAM